MRRRIDIAASLVAVPEILFLDEPTTGLDPRSRNQVWELVRRIAGEGTTVLLTTQYLDEADRLAERMAVIDQGRASPRGPVANSRRSVGSNALHLRLASADQQGRGRGSWCRGCWATDCSPWPTRRRWRRASNPAQAADVLAALAGTAWRSGVLGGEPEPGRGVPGAHRPCGQRPEDRRTSDILTSGSAGARRARSATAGLRAVGGGDPRLAGDAQDQHVPFQLFDVTAMPIMFTLLFTYIFGGALAGSPSEYVQYLLPGMVVQTIVFMTVYTGVGLNTDIDKGLYDRFRSLPMWQPAPLLGALAGDLFRYSVASLLILIVGFILGFRPQGGALGVLLAMALVMVFGFALSWRWIIVGMLVRSPESVMTTSFVFLMPLTFASDIFVDVERCRAGCRWS